MKLSDLAFPSDEEYFRTNLYEMSNYGSHRTGLPPGTNLWVRTEPQQHGHVKYRIKLTHPQKGDAIFALWGDEVQQVGGNCEIGGRELKKVSTLIRLTQEPIRQHIDGLLDSADLNDAFQQVKLEVEQA